MNKWLTLLILISTACFASENQLEFNLGRGSPQSSVQAGNSSDREGSRGTEWSADLLHQVGRQIYVGIGGGYFRSDDNVSEMFVPSARSTLRSKVTSVFVLSRVDLAAQSRMVPYLIAGVGWVKNSLNVSAAPVAAWPDTGTSEQRTLVDDSRNTLGFATGAGMDYALTDRVFIGVEARYQNTIKRTFDLTPAGAALTGQGNVQTPMNVFMWGVKAGFKY